MSLPKMSRARIGIRSEFQVPMIRPSLTPLTLIDGAENTIEAVRRSSRERCPFLALSVHQRAAGRQPATQSESQKSANSTSGEARSGTVPQVVAMGGYRFFFRLLTGGLLVPSDDSAITPRRLYCAATTSVQPKSTVMKSVQQQPTIAPELAELIDAVIVPALIGRILTESRGLSHDSLQGSYEFRRSSTPSCGEGQEPASK